ncbi:probable protein arginine N-methyltransferase 6.1 isoform X1 [Harmonia axyridis]|uniref:probable protein arginine N-methyltransferase 6.1 isoform X1 n=2 Tax=Harmonia axyridis TaxID=115357 RepID=UPI001E275216|nr:probable protein arginine N-methyltransferase 6.1 isoform X1 [Harmonia axyridis]
MDSNYIESYNDLQVHQLMLLDSARNQAYRQAVFDNKDFIQGKIVLDIGCGTGILSVFCAQAGAAKVYGVEASGINEIAKNIVKENKFENIIEIINSRIEDVTLPSKVDIIISEWMGFYLFHEGMLKSILEARDKFLKPEGVMFPESATLFAAPISVPSYFEKWSDIDGVSMNTFGEKIRIEASKKPVISAIEPDCILSDPEIVTWIDLKEITQEELKLMEAEHLVVCNKSGKYQGICLWFSCTFPSQDTEPIILSTGPEDPKTHWKQTIIVLPTEIEVEKGAPIAYKLSLKASEDSFRKYNLEVTMLDSNEIQHPEYCSCYMTKCIVIRAMLDKYEKDNSARA